jgi:phosphate/sulfate permease
MKLSNGTENFWSQIRNYILSSGLTIIVAFWYYGPKVGSIITFFLFLCFLWLLSDTKSKVLMGLPDEFQYESANLNDYPMLNFTWLQQQTND